MIFRANLNFRFIASPHSSGHNARRSTFGTNRLAKMVTTIGTVGINVAGIVRLHIRTGSAVIDIGGRQRNFLDKCRARIGANMGFATENRRLSELFDPMPVGVDFTR